MHEPRCSLRLTRRYAAEIEEVWEAVLDGRWLGTSPARVEVVEPGRVAELALPGSVARIELSRDGAATVLVLEHLEIPAPAGMRGMRLWTAALDRLEVAV
jgi:hypothetical protein